MKNISNLGQRRAEQKQELSDFFHAVSQLWIRRPHCTHEVEDNIACKVDTLLKYKTIREGIEVAWAKAERIGNLRDDLKVWTFQVSSSSSYCQHCSSDDRLARPGREEEGRRWRDRGGREAGTSNWNNEKTSAENFDPILRLPMPPALASATSIPCCQAVRGASLADEDAERSQASSYSLQEKHMCVLGQKWFMGWTFYYFINTTAFLRSVAMLPYS